MRVVIDRFEGEYAVCETENKTYINIEIEGLPAGSKEGDVLLIGENIVLDRSETEKRKVKIESLKDELWQ